MIWQALSFLSMSFHHSQTCKDSLVDSPTQLTFSPNHKMHLISKGWGHTNSNAELTRTAVHLSFDFSAGAQPFRYHQWSALDQ